MLMTARYLLSQISNIMDAMYYYYILNRNFIRLLIC